MDFIVSASWLGILIALLSGPCSFSERLGRKDLAAFGIVPWFVIGMAGYSAIAVVASDGRVGLTFSLVLAAAGVTGWLMIKAWRLKSVVCPFCFVAWGLNGLLLDAATRAFFFPR